MKPMTDEERRVMDLMDEWRHGIKSATAELTKLNATLAQARTEIEALAFALEKYAHEADA